MKLKGRFKLTKDNWEVGDQCDESGGIFIKGYGSFKNVVEKVEAFQSSDRFFYKFLSDHFNILFTDLEEVYVYLKTSQKDLILVIHLMDNVEFEVKLSETIRLIEDTEKEAISRALKRLMRQIDLHIET